MTQLFYLSTAYPVSLCNEPASYEVWPVKPLHAYDDYDLCCLTHLPNLLHRDVIVSPVKSDCMFSSQNITE